MQNNTITLKGVTETHIILAVNGKEHEILLNSNAFEQFFQSYNQTTFQSGNTIYNIEEIGTANFIFQIKSIAPKPKHLNHIPLALPPKVIGRKNDLEKVEELLFKDNALVIVNGIGGIGKTVLSHYYWQERQYKYTHLLWLKGEGNLQDSLIYDYNLHAGLGIVEEMKYHLEAIRQPNNVQAKEQAFACVATALKNVTPKGLMLIDNATAENHWTIKQWKTTFSNFHILVTSRETFANVTTYKLGYLSELEAIELFYLYYDPENNLPHDDAIVTEIVQKAGYHTLTIELLAMTLRDSDELTLATLAEKLAEHIVYISDKKKVLIDANYTQSRDYIDSIIEFAFDLSRLKKNEYALHLLTQISVLPSYNLRAEHLKQMLVSEGEDENQYTKNMQVLWKAGWIERFYDENGWFYNCHAVVQEVVRGKIVERHHQLLIENIKNQMQKSYSINQISSQIWIRYVEKVLEYVSYKNIEQAKFYNNLAAIYKTNAEYLKAEKLYELVIDILSSIELKNLNPLAIAYNNLATIYKDLCNYSSSLLYYQKSLSIRHKMYGEKHLTTSTSYNNIGLVYKIIGDYDNSLNYYQKALKIQEEILEPENPNLVITYNNMAGFYDIKADYEKALFFAQKAISVREKLLPANHHLLANSYNNIAITYKNSGDIFRALHFAQKAQNIWEAALPNNHIWLGTIYNTISGIYFDLDDYPNSIHFANKSIEIKEKFLHPNNPSLGSSYNNVASIYYKLQELNKALNYQKKAIRVYTITFGLEHLQTKTTLYLFSQMLECAIQSEGQEKYQAELDWFQENCAFYL
jgi:tetratricopeptide (TPR) repeat protein